MGFPQTVVDAALAASGRCCCICHKFCGTKIELHHIKQKAYGGEDTFENCIPLCFDCHEDMGKADPKHPKGKHYSENELKMHRDNWYAKQRETTNAITKNVVKVISTTTDVYINEAKFGTFTFDYSNNNGEFIIGKGRYMFRTKWSKASSTSIHAYKDGEGIDAIALVKAPIDLRNISCVTGDFSSRVRTPRIGDAIIWRNTEGKFAITKVICIKDNTRGDETGELECEYIILE